MIAHVIDNVPLCTLLRLSSYTDRMYVSAVATALSLEHAASFFCCLCCSVRSYLSTWKTCEISVIYLSNQIGGEATKNIRYWDKASKASKWRCDYTSASNSVAKCVVWNANAIAMHANANANATAKSCIGYNNSTGTLYPWTHYLKQ